MNDTGPSTGQFLVTKAMIADIPLWKMMAFEVALALRVEELKGRVELKQTDTVDGTLYQWRPVL